MSVIDEKLLRNPSQGIAILPASLALGDILTIFRRGAGKFNTIYTDLNTLGAFIIDQYFRRGTQVLAKGTHTIAFSSAFPAGTTYDLSVQARNAIGNVGHTELAATQTVNGFDVKVDLACTITYVATRLP